MTPIPPELLGPLGLTAFLLAVVVIGARYIIKFNAEVVADLRRQRDEAHQRARENDEALGKMAESNGELVAEVRRIADGIREGRLTVTDRRSEPRR